MVGCAVSDNDVMVRTAQNKYTRIIRAVRLTYCP